VLVVLWRSERDLLGIGVIGRIGYMEDSSQSVSGNLQEKKRCAVAFLTATRQRRTPMAVGAILVLGGVVWWVEMWTCKILDSDSRFFSFLPLGKALCFSLGRDDDRRSTWMPAVCAA
jgi:hypothetical protein